MAVIAKMIGLEKLRRKLAKIPEATKAEIRKAMAKQADIIVGMMKSLAPELTGALRESIGWTWGAAPKGSLAVATLKGAGVGGDLTLTIYAGGNAAYWARWQEFGTVNMPASPFFYVSFRANRKGAKRAIRAAVRKAAKKVAAG
jgi:HK97 gp10 family phage protein